MSDEKIKSRVSINASRLRSHETYDSLEFSASFMDVALRSQKYLRQHSKKMKDIAARLARFGLEQILDPLTYDLNTSTFREKNEHDRQTPFVFTSEKGLWSSEDGALEWARKCFRDQEDPETNTFKELVILSELFDDVDVRSRICQGSDYVSLIDLGCGNGEKAKTIVECLRNVIVSYFPVDKGMFMNAIALTNLANLAQREDCILADQNDLFYNLALVDRDKFSSLDELLKTAREALTVYDSMIGFVESFTRLGDKLPTSMFWFEQKEETNWPCFFNTCLEEIKQRRAEIQDIIERKDVDLLKKLFYFYEVVGRDCVRRMNVVKREDGGYTMGGLFADGIELFALGHKMTRYDWEKVFFIEGINNFWLIQHPDLVSALKNQKGFIQYTTPSVGINADFKDINKVIDVLNNLRAFENEPRIVMLLGQTLGNFDAQGRTDLCKRLYDNLSPGDMFLVGVELRPEDNDPLYDQEIERIKRNYLKDEEFARKALSRIDRINSNLKLDVKYDSESNDIVIDFVSSRRIILPKRTINVARSHKFSVNELEELFASSRFNIIGRRFYPGSQREFSGQIYDGRKEYAVYLVRK